MPEIREEVVRRLSAATALWGLIRMWQDTKRCTGFPSFLPLSSHIISSYLAITLLLHYYVILPSVVFALSFGCITACRGLTFTSFSKVICQLIVSSGVYVWFCWCLVILRWFAETTIWISLFSQGNLCTIYRYQAHPCDQLLWNIGEPQGLCSPPQPAEQTKDL